ncbi:LamG-like jellyroll fold domain-containing protein, partial [Streptomyces tateyamensis]
KLPATAWEASLRQDGEIQEDYGIAELTGLSNRPGWPDGMRLLVRRVRPAGRHRKKLTAFELKTGWKYSVIATNIRHMWGIAGSHQPQWLDAVAREHAVVEDRVRADKAMGLRNLPSKSWEVNRGWMLAANLGHDLDCWVRLLALHDQSDLEQAEPDTMRYRLYHLPARLPGPANGTTTCTSAGVTSSYNQATLWARERTTGRLLAYPIAKSPANNCANDYTALADPLKGTVIATGVDTTTYPVVGSVGDLNNDGIPDLYAQNSANKLVTWTGTTNTSGAVTGFTGLSSIGDLHLPLARYPLTSDASDASRQHNGTPTGDITFAPATLGGAPTQGAVFNATSNNGEIDTTLKVNTQQSFTLDTWARADQNDGIAISQDGTNTSNFKLWPATINGTANWTFAMATGDPTTGSPYDTTNTYTSAARVQAGTWAKLTASYNATTGQIALFVNGALAATGTHTVTIPATGNLVLGRYKNTGTNGSFFHGALADLSVYDHPTGLPTTLTGGTVLRPGDTVYAAHTMLTMQTDGNLVLYALNIQNTPTSQALWSTNTSGNPGAYATMQTDGNLVVYKPDFAYTTPGTSANALWSSATPNNPAAVAKIQDDCNFVIYNTTGTPVWNTHTYNPNP